MNNKQLRSRMTSLIADPADQTVKIPFKIVNGRITYFYGKTLPKLREGAIGDLILPASDVENSENFRAMWDERAIIVLDAGQELLVAMRERHVPADKIKDLYHCDPDGPKTYFHPPPPRQTTRLSLHPVDRCDPQPLTYRGDVFVEARLVEPLYLLLRGTKSAVLKPAKCYVPALDCEGVSVNHAYTLISEAFEPDRRSHTGNVFDRVQYFEGSYWRQLMDLRNAKEAEYEKQLIAEAKSRVRRAKRDQTMLEFK